MSLKRIALVCLLSALSVLGMADPASDAQMAEEALVPFIVKDPARRQLQLEERRGRLNRLAQVSPDSIRPATVVFINGLTAHQLQFVIQQNKLEVIDAHLKAPHGDNGVVMSLMLGSSALVATDGDLSSRLSFAIGAHQKCFAKSAKYLPADEAKDWLDLSTTPFLVYSARVFGSALALQNLQNSPGVRSVMLNVRKTVIDGFHDLKEDSGPNVYTMAGFLC